MSKLSPGRNSAASSWSTRLGKTGKPQGGSVVVPPNSVLVAQDGIRVKLVPFGLDLQELGDLAAIKWHGESISLELHIGEMAASPAGATHKQKSVLWFKGPWGAATVDHPGASLLRQHEQLIAMDQSGITAAVSLRPFLTPELADAIAKTQHQAASAALTQQLIDSTDTKRLDERREAMRATAVKAILQNSEWLTATQLSDIINPALKNKHAKASSFLKEKRVFALLKEGEYIYPRYQFDATGQPIPVVEQVLKVFDGYSSFRIAAWFESTSSALNGKRPREVLEQMGNEVLASAVEHTRGPMHG